MKRAKMKKPRLKPRNPLVAAAILRKAGAHRRDDKRASRAHQHARLRREIDET